MSTLLHDLRFALRLLRSRPGFSLIAVLTLALGIGANSAIFSVVDSLLLRPLPGARDAERLVSIGLKREGFDFTSNLSYPDYQDYRQLEVFDDASGSATLTVGLGEPRRGEPRRVLLTLVSPNYFPFLGVDAALGRTFLPQETDRMGAGNVLVLSHEGWKSVFAADPDVVGRSVTLNGRPFTVVGVAPESFPGTSGVALTSGYVPVSAGDAAGMGIEKWLQDRDSGGFSVLARLRPGVTLEQAAQATAALAGRLAEAWPDSHRGVRPVVHPESRTRIEPSAADYLPPIAAVFLVLVGLVLLIACANVANLLLVRGISREREIAVRAALGAGRARLVRQMVTESLVLALLGGAAGLLLAYWATDLLASLRLATDLPLRFDFRPNATVLAVTIGLTALSALVAGLVPSVQVSRTELAETLKQGGGRAGSGARHRLRSALVVVQLAVSLVLLTATGLFVRSMLNVAAMDPGFAVERRLMLTTDTDLAGLDEQAATRFYRDLLAEVRALPGVEGASSARFVPFGFNSDGSGVFLEGRDTTGEQGAMVLLNVVDTDYFPVMGTPLLRGRAFGEQDRKDSTPVVVVNERFAEQFFPGEDPLGRRISLESSSGPWLEIVGVARAGQYLIPGETPRPYLYVPFAQNFRTERVLHVWTKDAPEALVPALRERIHALVPNLPVFDVRTMRTHLREGKASFFFEVGSGLVGAFGLIGLVLAAIGLYGVMAFSVGQRQREFGIRMALGATTGRILRQVLGHGLALALAGIALGLLAARAVTGLFANLLVGVGPMDPVVLGLVALFLALVSVAASLVPALRATRVDPMLSLRAD